MERVKDDLAGNNKSGFFTKIGIKILDNIKINISNIHLQIESLDQESLPFVFGIGINELDVFTTNEKWEHYFLDRTLPSNSSAPLNKCIIANICIYFLTSKEGYVFEEVVDFSKPPSIPKEAHILAPIDITIHLTLNQNPDKAAQALEAEVIFKSLKLQVSKVHYRMYLALGERLSVALSENSNYQAKKRFAIYRPVLDIFLSDTGTDIEPVKANNAKLWWKYAITCVIRMNRERRTLVNQFEMSECLKKYYQKKFMEIFVKQQLKKTVTQYEEKLFEKIILIFEDSTIKLWIDEGMYQIEKNAQEKAQKPSGMLAGFLSWGAKEEKKVPSLKDDLTQIFEIIFQKIEQGQLQYSTKVGEFHFSGKFLIQKGKIKLFEKLSDTSSQSIEFRFQKISLSLIKQSDGIDLEAKVGGIELLSLVKPEREIIQLISMAETKTDYLNLFWSSHVADSLKSIKLRLNLGSLVFFYQQVLLLRLSTFLGNEVSSALTLETARSLSNIGVESIDFLRYSLEKCTFDIDIFMSSPIILLPIRKNNDPNSPLLVLKLGDLKANTVEQTEEEYLQISAKISAINLIYFSSVNEYLTGKEESSLGVIRDWELEMMLSVLADSESPVKARPRVKVTSSSQGIHIFSNALVYEILINLDRTLELESNVIQMLKTKKEVIIKSSKKMDFVQVVEGAQVRSYYVILSGAYLYFYQTNPQPYPSFYFYLPNSRVQHNISDLKENTKGILEINNGYQNLNIGFLTEKQCQDWFNLLVEHLSLISDLNFGKQIQRISRSQLEKVLAFCTFDLLKVTVHMLDDGNKEWILGHIQEFTLKIIARPADQTVSLTFSEIKVLHPDHPLCPMMVHTRKDETAIEVLIEVQKRFSPRYNNQHIKVTGKTGYLNVLFTPHIMQRFVQFLSTKGRKKDTPIPLSKFDDLVDLQYEEDCKKNCKTLTELEINVAVKFAGATLICLHHKFLTPYLKAKLGDSSFHYNRMIDHDRLFAYFGEVSMYDMTNHPHTYSPEVLHLEKMDYEEIEKQFTFVKLISVKAPPGLPTFDAILHEKKCSLRPHKVPHTDTSFVLRMEQVWALYVDELSLKRSFEYVTDKLVYSFNPYEDQPVGFPSEVGIFNFKEPTGFTQVKLEINSFVIEMRPRPDYDQMFCIVGSKVLLTNFRELDRERYIVPSIEQKLYSDILLLEGTKVSLLYNKEEIQKEFNISIRISTPSIMPEEYNTHDSKKVNLEMRVNIVIPEFLRIALNPTQINLLFQFIHLNLTYTDGLIEEFRFSRMRTKRAEDWLKINFIITNPGFTLELLDSENQWLTQLSAKDFLVTSQLYWNGRTVTMFTAQTIEMMDRDYKNEKVPMMFGKKKKKSKQDFSAEYEICSVENSGVLFSHSKWNIAVEDQQLIFRINSLYMILQVLYASTPNYEFLKDKPNKYYEQPSFITFTFYLNNATLFMQGEESHRGLAMEGDFSVGFEKYGYEDLTEAGVTYPLLLKENPTKKITVDFKKMSAYFCFSDEGAFDRNNLDNCDKRLMIEPVELIEYSDKHTAIISKDNTSRVSQEKTVIITDLLMTVTYLDWIYLLNLLQHHLAHMSLDYFQKQARYYREILPSLQQELQRFVFDSSTNINVWKIISTSLEAYNFYMSETNKLEQMRQQTLIRLKELFPISNPAPIRIQKRYTVSPLDSKSYLFSIILNKKKDSDPPNAELKVLLVNYFSSVFCPLFFVKLEGPVYRYQSDNMGKNDHYFLSKIEVHYYNCGASTMEPFVEPFNLEYRRQFEPGQMRTSTFLYNEVNVNVTLTLIELIKDSWKLWTSEPDKIKFQKQKSISLGNNEYSYETICEFAIQNRTGEDLTIIFKDYPEQKALLLNSSEVINICLNPSEVFPFYFQSGRRRFNIRVDFSPESKTASIENINLCRITHFTHSSENGDRFYDCSIQVVDMRKILTISPCNQLFNMEEMKRPILTRFEHSNGEIEDFIIQGEDDFLGVPYRLLDVSCKISLVEEINSKTVSYTFRKVLQELEKHQAIQISLGTGIYAVIAIQIEEKFHLQRLLLLPPYYISNCLPVPLDICFNSIPYSIQIPAGSGCYVHNQSVMTDCDFTFQIENFHPYILSFKYKPSQTRYPLRLMDVFGNETIIQLKVVLNQKARYQLIFYSKRTIINHTGDDLLYYAIVEETTLRQLAGQNIGEAKATLINKDDNFLVCLNYKDNSRKISVHKDMMWQEFSIPLKRKLAGRIDYVMKVDILNHIPNVDEVSTIQYSIYHKFFFRNNTNNELLVYQAEMKEEQLQKCPPNGTLSFAWTDILRPMKVQIEFEDNAPSEPFDITKIGTIAHQLMRLDMKTLGKIITIERTIEKGSFTIDIQEESLENPHYLIQNDSKYISISYRDKNSNRDGQLLDLGEKVPLGWAHPDLPHIIAIKLFWGKISEKSPIPIPQEFEYPFEIITTFHPRKIKLTDTESRIISVSVQSDGISKIMKISDIEKKCAENSYQTVSTYSISQLGVSLIAKLGMSRREIFYWHCRGISTIIREKNLVKEVELSIMEMQVDNQYNYEATYPIALRAVKENPERALLQIRFRYHLSSDPNLNFCNIDYISVNLLPIVIQLQEDSLIAFTDTIYHTLMVDRGKSGKEGSRNQITFNISKLSISPLHITISFKHWIGSHNKRNIVTKSLAAAFIQVQKMPVHFEKVELMEVFAQMRAISLILINEYTCQLENQKFNVAAKVLLSPFRDMEKIGGGITNFFKQKEDGSMDVVEGAGGLVKGAISGTFGTASNITSTISKGILALSVDDEYIREKQEEDEKYKPTNVVNGIGYGLLSALKSVASGMAGIVTKPIEGASQEGVSGFFKGAAKGIVGAVVKPVSGGLDLISKTAEGVANTTTFFDTNIISSGRVRAPRPFYSYHDLIWIFNCTHAALSGLIREAFDQRYATDHFLDLLIIENADEILAVIWISEERIAYLKKNMIVFEINTSSIVKVTTTKKSVTVHTKDKKTFNQRSIYFSTESQVTEFCEKLSQAL